MFPATVSVLDAAHSEELLYVFMLPDVYEGAVSMQ